MTMVDPRLQRRRKEVREQGARQRVGRLVAVLVGIGLVGAAVWTLQSPWLSVRHLEVGGVVRADVEGALARAGVRSGVPLVAVRAGRLEEALLGDPWVAQARVTLVFPDTVTVQVAERRPAARVLAGEGWMLVAGDGMILAPWDGGEAWPAVGLDLGAVHPGDRLEAGPARAALSFVLALPEELRGGAEVWASEGELWALVGGHRVRLGGPVEVEAKAAAVAAVLAEGLPEGAVLDVLAPSRPAVSHPKA